MKKTILLIVVINSINFSQSLDKSSRIIPADKIINYSDIIIKKFGFIIDSHPKYFYIHILLLKIHNKMLVFANILHIFSII